MKEFIRCFDCEYKTAVVDYNNEFVGYCCGKMKMINNGYYCSGGGLAPDCIFYVTVDDGCTFGKKRKDK